MVFIDPSAPEDLGIESRSAKKWNFGSRDIIQRDSHGSYFLFVFQTSQFSSLKCVGHTTDQERGKSRNRRRRWLMTKSGCARYRFTSRRAPDGSSYCAWFPLFTQQIILQSKSLNKQPFRYKTGFLNTVRDCRSILKVSKRMKKIYQKAVPSQKLAFQTLSPLNQKHFFPAPTHLISPSARIPVCLELPLSGTLGLEYESWQADSGG